MTLGELKEWCELFENADDYEIWVECPEKCSIYNEQIEKNIMDDQDFINTQTCALHTEKKRLYMCHHMPKINYHRSDAKTIVTRYKLCP